MKEQGYMHSTILYVGAGLDIRTVIRFASADQHIIMVDSQPFSEFGKMQSGIIMSHGQDGFCRLRFLPCLLRLLKKYRFDVTRSEKNPNVLIGSRNGHHILTYHINTSIPEDIHLLDLKSVDTLFVKGHHPHSDVVFELRNVTFVGCHGTCYTDEDEEESIVNWLYANKDQTHITRFVYFDGENKEVCPSWKEFVIKAHSLLKTAVKYDALQIKVKQMETELREMSRTPANADIADVT